MKECKTLQEVREEIDKIDDELVELIAKRNRYIHQAASFKNSIEEVKDEDRIDAVKQRVRAKAIELDVSPNMISELFTKMIDEMVESEIAQFRDTTNF
ncbi:chorismate mutase [Sulfurimonas lithotrophica]|uniref:chorismate mutase n=1 Tax=Sulfurimonas lithotrophica TaxID=2590022 RepID=A0A5P8P2X8_9BACT|nr:chorismate mutase [Sulfurimonas lithotrophica]QFR50088.1 chorismate mutase [Sulfurimonas lithotrophica]